MADVLTTVKMILRYVVSIEGREFDVVITSDERSYWNDLTKCSLMSQLRGECWAFNISLQASKEILVKALEIARKEDGNHRKVGFESRSVLSETDIAEMDLLLREFFWRSVEPRLSQNSGLTG